jgi:hypothetical protein
MREYAGTCSMRAHIDEIHTRLVICLHILCTGLLYYVRICTRLSTCMYVVKTVVPTHMYACKHTGICAYIQVQITFHGHIHYIADMAGGRFAREGEGEKK